MGGKIDLALYAGAMWAVVIATLILLGVFERRRIAFVDAAKILVLWTVYFGLLAFGNGVQGRLAPGLDANWLGRVATILLSVGVIMVDRNLSFASAGVRLAQAPKSLLPGLVVVATATAISLAFAALTGGPDRTPERYAHQLLMPTIDEELFYRAALFCLVAHAFGRSTAPSNALVTPQIVLTTIIFATWHGLVIHGAQAAFDPIEFAYRGALGWAMAWLRQSTGSIALPLLLHAATNVGPMLV